MRGHRISTAVLAALSLFGCRAPAPSTAAAPAGATQAPAKDPGDLGPPEGEPIHAVLTSPPNVPPPVRRTRPARVIAELEVVEQVRHLASGVDYTFWTFGGTVPGSFLRVRQGDTVEFHLKNAPTSRMPHNIDLHAVTGPGGGAVSTFTAPGHESVFTFKALRQGLYVYHCATAPVGMHIANGMYGLVLVEPPEGLSPVDHEYYVMQGDFYTKGAYHEPGLQPFDQEKAVDERPTYVLFNGAEGALTGDNALTARTGEKVRLFVGNGGPNLTSSFHVIGAIFDQVYEEGGIHPQANVQTTSIPPGGSAIVEFTPREPGSYALVDHAIFRAFNKGAVGTLKVEGPADPAIFAANGGTIAEEPGSIPAPTAAPAAPAAPAKVLTLEERKSAGEKAFQGTCAACHQVTGQGLPGAFPPLAKSDFLMADKDRAIGIAVHGLSGPVTVNGTSFNSVMPPMGHLSDDDLANILTYVRNSWGNSGEAVRPDEVAKARARSGANGGG